MQDVNPLKGEQPDDADMELLDRKTKRKLTKRKRGNPCMESQPLALVSQAGIDIPGQPSAAKDQIAGTLPGCAALSGPAKEASQAGPVPSSNAIQDHMSAQVFPKAAEGSLGLALSQTLQNQQAEALQGSDLLSFDRQQRAKAMSVKDMALTGSQDGCLAAVPASEDEAEVKRGPQQG